jgi:prepilin signal peptidase PulO-like enzyme (type II secretory pathway)
VGGSIRVLGRKPLQAPVAPRWLLVATCLLGMVAAALVAEAAFMPLWSAFVAAGAVGVAAVVALRIAHRATPVAAVAASSVAALAAVLGSHGRAWPVVALAGAGLGVAAVVDLLERRIPTGVAHGTTVVSLLGLVALALHSGRWGELGVAVGATALVVVVYAGLWFVRAMGFGDVRLAAATVSAGSAGTAYVGAMLFVPAVTLGVAGLLQLLVRRRTTALPFGPCLVAGWLVALGSVPP